MSKYRMLTARRLEERRLWALVLIIVLVLAGPAIVLTEEGLGSTHNSTLSGSVPLSSTISSVWGYNGSVYEVATLTGSSTTYTATFNAGFFPTHIVVFEKNKLYDINGLLNTSYYYDNVNLKTSFTGVTGAYANLTNMYLMVGSIVNDSSLKSISDKGFTSVDVNQTVYDANVNNLNQSVAMPLLNLFGASSWNDYVGYVANLNMSHTNKTGTMSVQITQQFQRPYSFNLIDITAEVYAVIAFIAVIMLINAMPRTSREA